MVTKSLTRYFSELGCVLRVNNVHFVLLFCRVKVFPPTQNGAIATIPARIRVDYFKEC